MIQRAQEVGVPADLITAARAVNRLMPRHVSGVLRDLLYRAGVPANGGKILFLGWSYKAGVGDARESPAEPLADSLLEAGMKVSTWDPYLSTEDIPDKIEVIKDVSAVQGFDMAVLVTAHPECIDLDWQSLLSRMRTPIVYDGRRVLNLEHLRSLGWITNAVGAPQQFFKDVTK